MAMEGYDLCEYCTDKLLHQAVFGEEVIDHDGLITVEWFKDKNQLDLPGIEAGPVLHIVTKEGERIEGLKVNNEKLRENISGDRGLRELLGHR
jgi:hypothetical protein